MNRQPDHTRRRPDSDVAATTRRAVLARLGAEDGLTLVELLISLLILGLVLGVTMSLLVGTQKWNTYDIERAGAIGTVQAGLAEMTRELRAGIAPNGTPLPSTAVNSLDLVVGNLRVKYDCSVVSPTNSSLHACYRYTSTNLATSPGPPGGQLVIDRVSNNLTTMPVFTPNLNASPTYYTAKIEVPARGKRTHGGYSYQVLLTDGIYLRNTEQANRAGGGQ